MTLETALDVESNEPESPDAAVEAQPADITPRAGQPKDTVFGSFWIEETEFALPVEALQEVVNAPQDYAQVPMSPPHMAGLFSLREMIIPVIDLRVLLGFPEYNGVESRKIALIQNGELSIGLLFDGTGGIINSSGAARVNFQSNEEGLKDVVVEGVLKLDNGTRLVQLLNPYELLKIDKLPRVTKENREDAAKSQKGHRRNCISFQLGHTICAMDLRYVQEITDVPDVQSSVLAHGHVLGNIELRGQTVPIVDFRGMIGGEEPYAFPKEALKARKLLILNLPEGLIGLLVYSIDSIMTFYDSEVLPFANVALPRHDLVSGCLINESDEIVILLDHDALLDDDFLKQAAQSCCEIYPAEEDKGDDVQQNVRSQRQGYVIFSVNMQFAFNISCVSEIINRPEKLLQPPYALNFVDGIVNLRGELITLINPRTLYQLPGDEKQDSKVLIFKSGSKKYGMVVDSVDEIINLPSSELLPIPTFGKNHAKRIVSQDVQGCLAVSNSINDEDHALVLDEAQVVSRCDATS